MTSKIIIEEGVLAPSNATLVERAGRIDEPLGERIAEPAEAREIPRLPGRAGQRALCGQGG